MMSCTGSLNNIEQYSIETLMSNNRTSGGYFSKDANKLLSKTPKITGTVTIKNICIATLNRDCPSIKLP